MYYNESSIRGADELLGPNVTQDVLEKANQWLEYLAERLGVDKSDIKPSYAVQELVTAFVYKEICVRKSYSATGVAWRDGERGDYYSQKLAYYDNQLRILEKRVTAADLTGERTGKYKGYRAIGIARG